jgi:hypothetical protein
MFYGVYYYYPSNQSANVQIVGFYDTLDKAKEVIAQIMPDYEPGYHNAVSGNGKIGWVNAYEMNQPIHNPDRLGCWQPHTSVNLFKS